MPPKQQKKEGGWPWTSSNKTTQASTQPGLQGQAKPQSTGFFNKFRKTCGQEYTDYYQRLVDVTNRVDKTVIGDDLYNKINLAYDYIQKIAKYLSNKETCNIFDVSTLINQYGTSIITNVTKVKDYNAAIQYFKGNLTISYTGFMKDFIKKVTKIVEKPNEYYKENCKKIYESYTDLSNPDNYNNYQYYVNLLDVPRLIKNEAELRKAKNYIEFLGTNNSCILDPKINPDIIDINQKKEFYEGYNFVNNNKNISNYDQFIEEFKNKIKLESENPAGGGRARKVHVGQRGGRYVIVKGKKRYI